MKTSEESKNHECTSYYHRMRNLQNAFFSAVSATRSSPVLLNLILEANS